MTLTAIWLIRKGLGKRVGSQRGGCEVSVLLPLQKLVLWFHVWGNMRKLCASRSKFGGDHQLSELLQSTK